MCQGKIPMFSAAFEGSFQVKDALERSSKAAKIPQGLYL